MLAQQPQRFDFGYRVGAHALNRVGFDAEAHDDVVGALGRAETESRRPSRCSRREMHRRSDLQPVDALETRRQLLGAAEPSKPSADRKDRAPRIAMPSTITTPRAPHDRSVAPPRFEISLIACPRWFRTRPRETLHQFVARVVYFLRGPEKRMRRDRQGETDADRGRALELVRHGHRSKAKPPLQTADSGH